MQGVDVIATNHQADEHTSDGLLTKKQIAARLAVSTRTVDEYMRKGRLPFLKLGSKTVRFRWRDVVEKLNAFRVN
jgi:excisionase family DNA binding protein